ncbi:MAG: hypothetical protein ACP6IS_02475 [Candidatus Asgardarchaeia archaeon]
MILEYLIVIIITAFIIFTLIGWKVSGVDKNLEKVIDVIVDHFIDERRFTAKKIAEIAEMDKKQVEKQLKKLASRGIVIKTGGWYQLKDPLVFLTERDYTRAIRLTRDDNILYGAYQHPYFLHIYFLGIYGIFLLDVAFAILIYLGLLPQVKSWLVGVLPGGETTLPAFLIFMIAYGIIIVDAIDNIFKGYVKEKYSVVIGQLSGISYDRSLADELSGRIRRGQISGVDLQLSLLQKLYNYFGDYPVGDIVVKVKGKKEPIIFKNMPYPREMFFVIRTLMLGSLGWRKRHARTLMLWRAKGLVPSVKS